MWVCLPLGLCYVGLSTLRFVLQLKLFFFFPLCCVIYAILVPTGRIEPLSPVVEARSLSHWNPRKFAPLGIFLLVI